MTGMSVTRLDPIHHKDLSSKAYEILQEKILRREFRGGDKLSVHRLAEMLDVSRTPVKDALNRLANEQFVKIFPRRGTYVVPITEQTIKEVFEIREILEVWAARTGVGRITENVLAQMERMLEETQRLIGENRASNQGVQY